LFVETFSFYVSYRNKIEVSFGARFDSERSTLSLEKKQKKDEDILDPLHANTAAELELGFVMGRDPRLGTLVSAIDSDCRTVDAACRAAICLVQRWAVFTGHSYYNESPQVRAGVFRTLLVTKMLSARAFCSFFSIEL
jgi:hypothetical protein